ncbi:IDEAL domain-containing protein [Ureibacillus sp. FSL K6-0165]|uniref:IDEAL domain-containing protein n=1 Tax=Ureibacillus sp. FSL K6-0165 TaxID=2954606 RepID=UPI0030F56ACD
MDKNNSYADFSSAAGSNPVVNDSEKLLNEIYVDLFLNRLQRLHRIEQLREFIDQALDERNEEAFYKYVEELIELQDSLN